MAAAVLLLGRGRSARRTVVRAARIIIPQDYDSIVAAEDPSDS